MRIGLRQIKGLSEAAGKKVARLRRQRAFSSIQQLQERAGLNRRDLDALAAAGALRSLDGHRHKVRWTVAGVEQPTPLLASLDRYEAIPMLRKPTEGQSIVADFKSLGLSLERHPMALLRHRLNRRRYSPAAELASMPTGREVRVAGLVITKQRPGTASGVIFITLEDETGHVNLIVWRKIAEEQRDVLLAARLMGIEGELQIEGKVIHVIVRRMLDHSSLLGELMVPSREFR
jgi:error-prone DNA polymerase